MDGSLDGLPEGVTDGEADGSLEGLVDGTADGSVDGDTEGNAEGSVEGDVVGAGVLTHLAGRGSNGFDVVPHAPCTIIAGLLLRFGVLTEKNLTLKSGSVVLTANVSLFVLLTIELPASK